MLQKVDIHTKRLLALADNIEHSYNKFDMTNWCDCIAGYAVRLFLDTRYVADTGEAARVELGLNVEQARDLFQPTHKVNGIPEVVPYTREEAAKAVRHLALAGEVVFS